MTVALGVFVVGFSSFLCHQRNEAKKMPLNSCVFLRCLAKVGASAYVPSFANHISTAIAGGKVLQSSCYFYSA